MTQPCNNDDRLLDYLYEEMSREDAQAFSAHVAGCQHCQREMQQFRNVRTAFHHLPPVAPAESVMQRMTAQLLDAARAAQNGAGPTPLSTPGGPSAGGDDKVGKEGKVLAFRKRGVMRVLLHPASGILAAAAVALVVVMTQNLQYRMPPREAAAPVSTPKAFEAEQGPKPAATPTPEAQGTEGLTTTPAVADKSAAVDSARRKDVPAHAAGGKARLVHLDESGTDGALAGEPLIGSTKGTGRASPLPLAKSAPAPAQAAPYRDVAAPKKPAPAKDDLDSLFDRPAEGKVAAKKEAAREEPPVSPATPPPPAAAPPPARPAPAPQQEQKAVVGNSRRAASSPIIIGGQQAWRAPESDAVNSPERWRAPQATGSSYGASGGAPADVQSNDVTQEKDDLQARTKNAQQNDLNRLLNRRGHAPAGPAAQNADPAFAQLLMQLREQLKKGECPNAGETLSQIGRRFPGLVVPEKDQTAYQQTCVPVPSAAPNYDQAEAPMERQVQRPIQQTVQRNVQQKAPAPRSANRAAAKSKKSGKAQKASDTDTANSLE